MNTRFQLLTICLFFVLSIQSAQAANIYILQDNSCMDRLVYSKTSNGAMSQHITYRIKINPVEFVYLEIGTEDQFTQEFLPTQVYSCGSNLYGEKFVENINNNRDQVHLVLRLPNNKYGINKVQRAAYFQHIGETMTYISDRYSFALNKDRGVIGEDISVGKARNSEIFFEGKLETDCSGAFLFRRIAPREDKPHTDFVFIPEIGLSEDRSGANANDAFNNVLRLEKVNDYTPKEYLRLLCVEKPMAKAEELTVKTVPQQFDQTPKTTAPDKTMAASNPCGEAAEPGYHFVQKGETLYRISKAYNVTVSQVKEWNKLQSNTIHPCDKLQVAATTTTVKSPATSTTLAAIDKTPAVTVPAPYDNTMTPKSVAAWERAWEKTDGYHVVLPGETVASIALKYGFTEARFRDINGLGIDEMVKIGQPLKTTDCPPGTLITPATSTRPTEFSNTLGPQGSDLTIKSPIQNQNAYNFGNEERITPQFYMRSEMDADIQAKGGVGLSPELARRAANTSGSSTSTAYDQTIPQGYESAAGSVKRATHTVKDGETLYRIARMYGISVERLRMLNNLSESEVIVPFQRLYIN